MQHPSEQCGSWQIVGSAASNCRAVLLCCLAALLSAAGLFLSNLLTNSRLPFVLGRDSLLPRSLGLLHSRYATPWVAIVLSSGIYSALALLPFTELGAFLAIRVREPALVRPWRVPGGLSGALLVVAFPSSLALLAMATSGLANTLAGGAAALSGPLAYWAVARSERGPALTAGKA